MRGLILLVAVAGASATASADEGDGEAKRAASRILQEGLERVEAHDYAAALARFEAAYENPSESEDLSQHRQRAEGARSRPRSRRSVRAVSPQRAGCRRRLPGEDDVRARRARGASLSTRTPRPRSEYPLEATLVLDGRPHDVPSGLPVYVRPGTHGISVNASGRQARALRIEIGAGEERKERVVLDRLAATPAVPPVAGEAPPAAPRRRLLPWIAAGSAVVVAAAGTVVGLHARGVYSDYEESLSKSDFDRASSEGLVANVLFVGAGACALTAVALFLFTDNPQASSAPRVELAVGSGEAWSIHLRGPF